jgi:O-antigen/teichoic acid export membrane protein
LPAAILRPSFLIRWVRAHIHSLISLAVRAVAVLLGFVVTFLIGHNYGPEANGHYALITQSGMLLSVIAVGGIDMAVVRKLSEAVAKKIPVERATLLKLVAYSLGFAALLSTILALSSHWALPVLFKGEPPRDALLLIILILFARALTRLMSSILRSQKAYTWGQLVEALFIPLIVVVAILVAPHMTVDTILWVTAIGGLATGAVALISSLPYTASGGDTLHVPMADVLKVALPLWGVAIFLNISEWYSLASASAVLGVHEAGLYRVAIQVASALGIVTMGLFSVYSPQISAANAGSNKREVAALARSATRLSLLFSLPVALAIFIFAPEILNVIGPEFAEAAPVLRIVIVGQAVYTATGPSGLVLAMTGHEKINFWLTMSSTAALLVSAPLAAYFAGLVGISIAVAVVTIARNLGSFYAVWKKEGINVMTGHIHKAPLSAP